MVSRAITRCAVALFVLFALSTPAWAQVYSGTYTGDGFTSQSISGVPFRPDVLIIKGNDIDGPGDTTSAVFVTSSMPVGMAKPLKGTQPLQGNLVQSLDANGFTVGGARGTNQTGVTFFYTAFRADSDVTVGSYTGNGSTQSFTGFGFTPDYIIVAPDTSNHAVQRSYQDTDSWPFWASAPISNAVTSFDPDGFTVGGSVNANEAARTFHYVAWNEVAGKMKTGWYFGDGINPHAITDVGFQPEYLIVKAIDQNEHPIQRFTPMSGDASVNFMATLVTNRIVAFEPGGFRVGSNNEVNRNSDAYIYVAFGNGSKPPMTVVDTGSTVTVTSPTHFEMTFDTFAGGGIREFYDLASGENRTLDLVGGSLGVESLTVDTVNISGSWYNVGSNDTDAKLDLIEATGTRVLVRREAFYQEEGGTVIQPGLKGFGDYAIYGTGRMALEWERRTTSAVAVDADEIGINVSFPPVPPLSNWQAFSESGPAPGAGTDDFVMLQIHDDTFGIYTDFLQVLSSDWPEADSTEFVTNTPDEWAIAVWDNADPRVLPALEQLDSLIYFKPTDLFDGTDPKVLARRNDYRAPDPLVVAIGAGWNENTADSDFYNESEAAYTLDMDPVSGLRFDMDGVATKRLTPFFKVRQWRSLQKPPRVMLEGAVLVNNVHYEADVKPVARAYFADDLLWHSTFENAAAVVMPDVGSAGAIAGGLGFAPSRYGNSARFDAPAKNVTFPGVGNLDTTRGTIEFWMMPFFNHDDNVQHQFWTYYVDANNYMLVRKRVDNQLEFEIRHAAVSTQVLVGPPNFSWRAFDSVHLRVSWNMAAGLGNQARIFLNGVEPVHIDPVNPFATAVPLTGTNYIGANQVGTISADASIDEVRVYSTPNGAVSLAHGGLGSHPSEYLATPGSNFSFDFNTLDGSSRGEYLYFGADARFRGLNVSLATQGIGTADLHWEYWNGAFWADLESVAGFIDETAHFAKNGSVYWAEDPPLWSLYSVFGEVDLFYVRVHLESGAYGTRPVEDRISTDILLFQYCDDIMLAAQTFDFDVPPNPDVTISSFLEQTFTVGFVPSVVAATVTVTDVSGSSVTAGGDIRIRIPAGFNMRWDSAVGNVGLTGTAVGKVLPDVVYEDLDETVVLNVITDFAAGENIRIDNLAFMSFLAPSPPDSLELETTNDGSVAAVDDKLVEILPNTTPVLSSEFDQVFTVSQPPTLAATMYVTEGLSNHINTTNHITVRIPAAYQMFWDTGITTAIIGGTGAGNVNTGVAYAAANREVIITVTNNFAPGQHISISGLGFTGFLAAALPDNLELDVGSATDDDDKTIEINVVGEVPFFTATATSLQVVLEWVTPSSGTCVDVLIVRRLAGDPTPGLGDWFNFVPCGGLGVPRTTTDFPPVNDQAYTYGAFVHDGVGGYSGGQLLKARPFNTSGRVKWAYSTAAASMAPPGLRFSGGAATVYAVSNDNILHAIQGGASGGTWPAGWVPRLLGGPAQARPPVVPFTIGPATNGVAFLGSHDGSVYAINADDGSVLWNESIATMVQAAPAGNFLFYDPAAKDLLLVGTRNSTGANKLQALKINDGFQEWAFINSLAQGGDDKDIGIISGSVAIDYSTRRLFFASRQRTGGSANTIWCIDFDSGAPNLVWAKPIGDIDGSPILWGGVVYVGTNAGSLYALDETDGSNKWPPLALGDGAIKGFVFPQFGTDNRLISTTTKVWSVADSGASVAVNPAWPVTSANVPSPSIPTYVPGSSELYVGSSDGKLYQLNVTTPVPTVSVTLGDGGGAVGTPTVDLLNTMIYVGTDQGVIYGVELPLP